MARLGLISDLHMRFLSPEKRVDTDFFEDVVMHKYGQLYQEAHDRGCEAILQGGDIVDNPDVSRYVISRMMLVMRKFPKLKMYSCVGQHDLAFRNFAGIKRTSSYLLEAAGLLQIVGLDKKPVILGDVALSGLSFEQDYDPKPVEGKFNILLAHATVGDKPLYPGHELPGPKAFARQHPGFSVILLGDIHYGFTDKIGDCQIYNTGVMIRKSITEKEQRPNFIIYDTDTRETETVYLDAKPWQEVFQITEGAEAASSEKLQEFLAAMRRENKSGVTFNDNLRKYYSKNEVTDQAKCRIAAKMELVGLSEKEKKEISNGG